MHFKRILAALNRDPIDPQIFDRAMALARDSDAELMLVHVMDGPTPAMTGAPATIPADGMSMYPAAGINPNPAAVQGTTLNQEDWNQQLENVNSWLRGYQQKATAQGVTAQFDCRTGSVGRQICQVAEGWAADLVVTGRRGHSGLAEALMGSVSNHVVHHAPCSVLVIQGEAIEENQ